MKPLLRFSRGDACTQYSEGGISQSADLAATDFSEDDFDFDGFASDDDDVDSADLDSAGFDDVSSDVPLVVDDADESDSVLDGLLLA